MKKSFIKVASCTSDVYLGDLSKNIDSIKKNISLACEKKVKILCFQELNITGYSLMDLYKHEEILNESLKALLDIKNYSSNKDIFIVVSLPIEYKCNIYIAACAIFNGHILGIQLKTNLPNYQEFSDSKYFSPSFKYIGQIKIDDEMIPIGNKLLFNCTNCDNLIIGIEICEDLWAPISISTYHALNGATIILNPSASNELIGKDQIRKDLISITSRKLNCCYVYANAGFGESSQDVCFISHNLIAEKGQIIAEKNDGKNGLLITDVCLTSLSYARKINSTFKLEHDPDYSVIDFMFDDCTTILTRTFSKTPYLHITDSNLQKILSLQTQGLKGRLNSLNIKDVVLGVSGGLDSALALLVCYRTFKEMKLGLQGIHAFSLPAFATSTKTKNYAKDLITALGIEYNEVDLTEILKKHLEALNHPLNVYDTVYENIQARERTAFLMNYANGVHGIVIGTSDLSEISLGFSTYNGDQMSMYNPNGSLYKTVIRKLIEYIAKKSKDDQKLSKTLLNILNTPISPELIPDKNMQDTERIIGPYILHDYFIYHFLQNGISLADIYQMAKSSFKDQYDSHTIFKTLKIFITRFIANQFKRNTMPDSPKILDLSLSTRADLRMPADMKYEDLLKGLKEE